MEESLTLLQLNQLIAKLMTVPETQNVWVTAELSDVGVRGGHCYMELLQKDERGNQLAKARAVIWANNYRRIASDFFYATGQPFATGLKLMVRASATMHPLYGMSLVITGVNPEYTMGDLLRRRNEIIARLKADGVLDLNKSLQWPDFPSRIAVISAPGAAGYGDFINQLCHNPAKLRFTVRLFPAVMQGERAPSSVINALSEIALSDRQWDCVVIIRGGGATSDLQAFEDYELASSVAQFPLPVIIGIGHERDISLLDYVANLRVKTPTAAAEWLINRGETLLHSLQQLGASILQTATDIISCSKEQLGYLDGLLPVAPVNAMQRASDRLRRATLSLGSINGRRIAPALERISLLSENIAVTACAATRRAADKIRAAESLLNALSPEAVLSRGYSITRIAGHAIRSSSDITSGSEIETVISGGSIRSSVISVSDTHSI